MILASSADALRASLPSSSSSSSASSKIPERICLAWYWIEAVTQAARMSCSSLRDRVGVRWLPVRNPSITLVRSRSRREVSTSKCRKIRVRSPSGSSTSLTSQCSTSTLGLVRDRQSPAADCKAFKQVWFKVLIRAAESTPIVSAPRAVAWNRGHDNVTSEQDSKPRGRLMQRGPSNPWIRANL